MKRGTVRYDEILVERVKAALGAKSLSEVFAKLVQQRECLLAIEDLHDSRGGAGKNVLKRDANGERYIASGS